MGSQPIRGFFFLGCRVSTFYQTIVICKLITHEALSYWNAQEFLGVSSVHKLHSHFQNINKMLYICPIPYAFKETRSIQLASSDLWWMSFYPVPHICGYTWTRNFVFPDSIISTSTRNVVICLPTEHLGVLKNLLDMSVPSRLNIRNLEVLVFRTEN